MIKKILAFPFSESLKPLVVFMLGGPGSGKGTQSQLIQSNYHFKHLSAGQLLRAERKREGSEDGALIEHCIVSGNIVPSRITVKLLEKAMNQSGWNNGKFLIDGFPRNMQNFNTWNQLMSKKVENPFIVFLDCSEETMLNRLMKRSATSGRSDDNRESILKRFETYQRDTMPVVNNFREKSKIVEVSCEGSVQQIFAQIGEGLKRKGVH